MEPTDQPDEPDAPDDAQYAALLGFRDGLRQFLRWSEDQARAVGMTPTQHQLLLVVRGHEGPCRVTDVADHLLLRHHSAVELVDRAEHAGLVARRTDERDQRVVLVELTRAGARQLDRLSAAHLEELSRIGPRVAALWRHLPGSARAIMEQ
jgi:DNA-binding MarR family transcriptional regulator